MTTGNAIASARAPRRHAVLIKAGTHHATPRHGVYGGLAIASIRRAYMVILAAWQDLRRPGRYVGAQMTYK